jgi:hypothetical protein
MISFFKERYKNKVYEKNLRSEAWGFLVKTDDKANPDKKISHLLVISYKKEDSRLIGPVLNKGRFMGDHFGMEENIFQQANYIFPDQRRFAEFMRNKIKPLYRYYVLRELNGLKKWKEDIINIEQILGFIINKLLKELKKEEQTEKKAINEEDKIYNMSKSLARHFPERFGDLHNIRLSSMNELVSEIVDGEKEVNQIVNIIEKELVMLRRDYPFLF